jgi:hypothetical protein
MTALGLLQMCHSEAEGRETHAVQCSRLGFNRPPSLPELSFLAAARLGMTLTGSFKTRSM